MVKGLVTLKLAHDLLGNWMSNPKSGTVRHLIISQSAHSTLNAKYTNYMLYAACGRYIRAWSDELTNSVNDKPLCSQCLKHDENYAPMSDGKATYILTRSGKIYPQIDTVEMRLTDEEYRELVDEELEDRWPKITGTSN